MSPEEAAAVLAGFAANPAGWLERSGVRDVPQWASLEAAAEANVPEAGHMLMMEQPDAFMRSVLNMLA